jgi:hypothetical protein
MPTSWTQCSPNCDGWAVFWTGLKGDNDCEIQSCDECNRFATDEDAREHARKLIETLTEGTFVAPMRDTSKRYFE